MTDHAPLLNVVRSVRRRWRLRVMLRGAGILLLAAVALLAVAGLRDRRFTFRRAF